MSSTREIVSRKEGPNKGVLFTFRTITVIGEGTLVEARLADDHQMPAIGSQVAFRASVGAYNGQPDFTIEEFLDGDKK